MSLRVGPTTMLRALVWMGPLAAVALATSVASAQEAAPASTGDGIAVGDVTLRPTLEVRTRLEYRRRPADLGGTVYATSAVQGDAFGSAAPTVGGTSPLARDAYGASERVRLGLGVEYGRVRAKVTLQDARQLGSSSSALAGFGPTGRGALEPYEAYLDVRNDEDAPTIEARVGRQAVGWGEGRLLGTRDWWQRGASLDAVRVQAHFARGLTDVEALAAVLATPGEVPPPAGVNGQNRTGSGAELFGLRNAWHVAELLHLELAALGRIVRDPLPSDLARGDTLTADARAYGDYRGVSYSAEGAYQLGRVAGYGINRSLAAFAGAARVDWQTALPLDLRLGLAGSYASGDASRGKGASLKRFDPILADVHRHHGMMDLVAWSNLIDGAATVGAKPHRQLDTSVRYALLALADPSDRWTSSNLLPIGVAPDNTSRLLGHEVDVRVAYEPTDGLRFDAGYGMLLTGAGARHILEAAGRGSPDLLHFGYVQAGFRVE